MKYQSIGAKLPFLYLIPLLLHSAIPASAATIHVPGDHDTIQFAIWYAADGDTVLVADGTYTGTGNRDVDFDGKAIVVRSETGATATVIDCEGAGRGFQFLREETADSRLEGFTVTNGYSETDGGAIYCRSSSPTIRDCTIAGNTASTGGGIGCYLSSPLVENCVIEENFSYEKGGAIYCRESSPTLSNCFVERNSSASFRGGIYCEDASCPEIIDCVISENRVNNWVKGGGGILCSNSSDARIVNCLVQSNRAGYGGGIQCIESSPLISRCTILENNADWGGGINCGDQASPDIVNCIIAGNQVSRIGGGIRVRNGEPNIVFCTLTSNEAWELGGGIGCDESSSSAIITDSIVWDNMGGEIGGDGDPHVTYSDVKGGCPGVGNIDADPLFFDPENRNYHILPGSPCMDAGFDVGIYIDIDGDERPQSYDFDMGADEIHVEGPMMKISPTSFSIPGYYESEVDSETLSIISMGTESLEYEVLSGVEPWLTLSGELQGELAPADTGEALLNIDVSGMYPGVFADTIAVLSNDPDRPEILVPVELEILSPVIVDVECPDPNVKRGQTMQFDIILENVSDQIQTFDLWIDVFLIGGEPYQGNPVAGPGEFMLGPSSTIDASYSIGPIPRSAPLGGPYRLDLSAGDHPFVLDGDSFDFYVVL